MHDDEQQQQESILVEVEDCPIGLAPRTLYVKERIYRSGFGVGWLKFKDQAGGTYNVEDCRHGNDVREMWLVGPFGGGVMSLKHRQAREVAVQVPRLGAGDSAHVRVGASGYVGVRLREKLAEGSKAAEGERMTTKKTLGLMDAVVEAAADLVKNWNLDDVIRDRVDSRDVQKRWDALAEAIAELEKEED